MLDEARVRRVWSKIRREGDCLLWHGKVDRSGYPFVYHGKQRILVRDFLAIARDGNLPASGRKRNQCGHRNCVNPDHWEERCVS